MTNQAKTKQRVQLTSDEISLLQALVVDEVNKRIITNQPIMVTAVLLAKLGKAKNRCAIMESGGHSSGGKEKVTQAG